MIGEAREKCREILLAHKDKLEFVAQFLLAHETMDGDQFQAAMERTDVTMDDLVEIAEEKARRSREANEQARIRREQEQAEAEHEDGSDEDGSSEDAPDENAESRDVSDLSDDDPPINKE